MNQALQTIGGERRHRASPRPIRLMIVDDSLTARTVLSRIIEPEPDLVIVAKATTGEMAIARLAEQPADVVLLDLEMPGMGGLGALPRILELARGGQVLVVSSLTAEGAEHTLAALSMGAADTLLKPRAGEFGESYARALLGKIRALGRAAEADNATFRPATPPPVKARATRPPRVVAVGASTGGIHALCLMLRALPARFELPILVTQHLPASFMPVLARQLAIASGREAEVAAPGSEIRAGRIYVAPGEGHMTVHQRLGRLVTGLAHHPVASGCMPSVDPLFESLAEASDGQAMGVVLSGMGRDGLEGAAKLVAAGGTLFAQDAATSSVWGMPRAIAQAGLATAVLPPEAIAGRLVSSAGAAAWK
jgi:two-component system chemotaxis response regulator CheB